MHSSLSFIISFYVETTKSELMQIQICYSVNQVKLGDLNSIKSFCISKLKRAPANEWNVIVCGGTVGESIYQVCPLVFILQYQVNSCLPGQPSHHLICRINYDTHTQHYQLIFYVQILWGYSGDVGCKLDESSLQVVTNN